MRVMDLRRLLVFVAPTARPVPQVAAAKDSLPRAEATPQLRGSWVPDRSLQTGPFGRAEDNKSRKWWRLYLPGLAKYTVNDCSFNGWERH